MSTQTGRPATIEELLAATTAADLAMCQAHADHAAEKITFRELHAAVEVYYRCLTEVVAAADRQQCEAVPVKHQGAALTMNEIQRADTALLDARDAVRAGRADWRELQQAAADLAAAVGAALRHCPEMLAQPRGKAH